ILASQGISGFLGNELCLFSTRGLTTNIPNNASNVQDIVNAVTSSFISFLSESGTGSFNILQVGSSSNPLKVELSNLTITPSRSFYFYTQDSGMWSEATNINPWYHDGQGNPLTTFDIYNEHPSFATSSLLGSYLSGSYIRQPNPSAVIDWPNPSELWRYISGHPTDSPALTSFNFGCS